MATSGVFFWNVKNFALQGEYWKWNDVYANSVNCKLYDSWQHVGPLVNTAQIPGLFRS